MNRQQLSTSPSRLRFCPFEKMNAEFNTAILLITHDLGVVHNTCERVMIMYAGRIVEEGGVTAVLDSPKHPYTKGLFASIPAFTGKSERLSSIEGQVPKPGSIKRLYVCAEVPS